MQRLNIFRICLVHVACSVPCVLRVWNVLQAVMRLPVPAGCPLLIQKAGVMLASICTCAGQLAAVPGKFMMFAAFLWCSRADLLELATSGSMSGGGGVAVHWHPHSVCACDPQHAVSAGTAAGWCVLAASSASAAARAAAGPCSSPVCRTRPFRLA